MLFRATPVIATFVFLVATLSTNTSSVQCFAFHHDSPRSNVFKQPSSNRLLVQLETKAVKADVLSPIRKNAFYLISTCITFAVLLLPPSIAWADGQTKDFKFPPIDYGDKSRCVLKGGSSMGQANAARDKLYDLRQCQLSGINAAGYDLSGVIMTSTDLSKAILKEAQFSKGFLQASNFDGADFSNAIVDRANFQGSSLRGTIFNNAVLTGTSFENADLENADFTEAAIGVFDVRNICKNPTLKGENPITGADTRLSIGCK